MTMHLLGPAYTTTKTSTKASKLTSSKFTKYAQDWVDYNKQQKRLGLKTKTLDEYVSYRQGKTRMSKSQLRGTPMPEYKKDDHRTRYPSQSEVGIAFAKQPNTYTGTKLLGIATMHKSNMVPVFSQEDAEQIAKMRRG